MAMLGTRNFIHSPTEVALYMPTFKKLIMFNISS